MTPPMTRGARGAGLARRSGARQRRRLDRLAAEPQPAAKGPARSRHSRRRTSSGRTTESLLAKARTKGDKRVTVMLATTKGSTKSVAAAVKAAVASPPP